MKGLHTHRFKNNPVELAFAQAWEQINALSSRHLGYLLTPPDQDQHFPEHPSERDEVVAATVIQWLGSPVGQQFLKDVHSHRRRKGRVP